MLLTDELEKCPVCRAVQKNEDRKCEVCLLPQVLIAGKYKVIRRISEGAFSVLYLAKHIFLDSESFRAIKVFKPNIFDHKEMEIFFKKEVLLTASLSEKNEHIVRVYDDFGKAPGIGYFYVMEYLGGDSLKDLVFKQGLLTRPFIFHVLRQICLALSEAHKQGVIHQALKPEKIFLVQRSDNPNFVKIVDFRIAKIMGNSESTTDFLGSPSYISPEQCINEDINVYSDIYSLGVMLYELLTGCLPFGLKSRNSAIDLLTAHLTEPPVSMREQRPDLNIPVALDLVVLQALEKDPESRYASINDFWRALEPFATKPSVLPVAMDSMWGESNPTVLEDQVQVGDSEELVIGKYGWLNQEKKERLSSTALKQLRESPVSQRSTIEKDLEKSTFSSNPAEGDTFFLNAGENPDLLTDEIQKVMSGLFIDTSELSETTSGSLSIPEEPFLLKEQREEFRPPSASSCKASRECYVKVMTRGGSLKEPIKEVYSGEKAWKGHPFTKIFSLKEIVGNEHKDVTKYENDLNHLKSTSITKGKDRRSQTQKIPAVRKVKPKSVRFWKVWKILGTSFLFTLSLILLLVRY